MPLRRHAYGGGPAKPDCVEQCLRELFSLLLWCPKLRAFDCSQLPPSTTPQLAAFFGDPALAASTSDGSARWFELCQGISGCDYLSCSPDGSPYELAPRLANLSAAAGYLLGEDGCGSLADLQVRNGM